MNKKKLDRFYTERIGFRTDEITKERLDTLAATKGITTTQLIRSFVHEGLRAES